MKILFSTGELEKNFTATNKIAFQIAQGFANQGDECIMTGFCTLCAPFVEIKSGVKLIHLSSSSIFDKAQSCMENFCLEKSDRTRDKSRKAFAFLHPFYSLVLAVKYSSVANKKSSAASYKNQLEQIISLEKPDKIIVTYMPFDLAECVFNISGVICPIFAYQMDPWGLHRLPELAKDKKEHIESEVALFEKAAHIFTTKVLLRQYSSQSSYAPYTSKMTALDFPNIRKIPLDGEVKSVFEFDSSYTNVLFCGILEDNYRSPKEFLKAISPLLCDDKKIRLYFLGNNLSDSLKKFKNEFPEFIFICDSVSLEKAFATMQQSDILLNISNSLDNQVPSKIFDYFSLGKPILNVQKIESCPSREYFDKYPLSYTFEDYKKCDDGMENFLRAFKGKTLEYQQVEKLFFDATTAYASKVIHDEINR